MTRFLIERATTTTVSSSKSKSQRQNVGRPHRAVLYVRAAMYGYGWTRSLVRKQNKSKTKTKTTTKPQQMGEF